MQKVRVGGWLGRGRGLKKNDAEQRRRFDGDGESFKGGKRGNDRGCGVKIRLGNRIDSPLRARVTFLYRLAILAS